MKLTSVALLCLTSLLVLTHFTLARKGSSSWGGKSTPSRSNSGSSSGSSSSSSGKSGSSGSSSGSSGGKSGGTSNRGSTTTVKKTPKGPQTPPGSYPKQATPNQWRPASNQWGYPQPGRGGSYPNQHPAGGYGYGGGHPNYNPNNKVLSPGYGGSYGYGGKGGAGGSPFARSVAGMGMNPSAGSKGFGRTAVVATGVGVMSGMALGYGLGRFPRPPFQFHNSQEEKYYNHYVYKKYGTRSTDQDDYSRDYKYTPAPIPFDKHMDTCMKRQDLFPSENKQGTKGPAKAIPPTAAAAAPPTAAAATTTAAAASPIVDIVTANSTSSNASGGSGNDTAIDTNLTAPCPNQTNKPCADPPLPPAVEDVSKVANRDDVDDTVSIVEIGYPALIDQLKAMRCVELYVVYSDTFLQKLSDPAAPRGGAQGTGKGLQQVSTVVTGTLLMLVSSVVLMLP